MEVCATFLIPFLNWLKKRHIVQNRFAGLLDFLNNSTKFTFRCEVNHPLYFQKIYTDIIQENVDNTKI